ncbi:hypothetical protein [Lysobacter sp. Root983]|uniref:hypothetical protein n=1 Tax=Lysobacter sp. Root983 TaxID=1736613 RepID=UPI00070A084D|nr:hypothetical protein [Lysobacter sp. Root983]KRD79490.1 hypothetical protein ASE43_00785 [Lysobacter sp. Root983]
MRILASALILAIGFASAPAGARKLQYALPPAASAAGEVRLVEGERGALPPEVSGVAYLDEARSVGYRQDFGGMGVAGGLLLGPFGAGANALAIQKNTAREAEALRGKLGFAPDALLLAALTAMPASASASREAKLRPSLYLTRDKQERLIFWTIVDVDLDGWRGRYSRVLPARVASAAVVAGLPEAERAVLETQLRDSYIETLKVLQLDLEGRAGEFAKMKVEVEALAPRFHAAVKYEFVRRDETHTLIRALAPSTVQAAGLGFSGVLIVPNSEALVK